MRTSQSLTVSLNSRLPGSYTASIQGADCRLELRLDATGCLSGSFTVDCERLEIMGGVPNAYGEVFGLIREPGGDTLAVFRAICRDDDLVFEVDTPGQKNWIQLEDTERVLFRRDSKDAQPFKGTV